MSDDLISRRGLLGALSSCNFGNISTVSDSGRFPTYVSVIEIKKIIRNRPVAFDKEKVIKELEDYLFETYCVEGDEKMGEIIKKGGIEK